MAMNEYLTDAGSELLGKMLAGRAQITFTKVEMGDGTLAPGQIRQQMTALVNLKATLDIYSVNITPEQIVEITAIFENAELTDGFYYREKGVYATDGTNEVLFAYSNAGSSAEYINPPTVEVVEKEIISLYKGLQSTTNPINITIVSGIYATKDYVDSKIVDPDGDSITLNAENQLEATNAKAVNGLEFSVVDGILSVTYEED